MAMRAVWKGTVGFGLVTVPTKVFTAAEDKAVKFARLHGECKTHIVMQNYCPKCAKVVEFKDLIAGFKLGEDEYLAVEKGELESIKTKSQGHIDILEFVPLGFLQAIMLEHPYYMAPDRGDKKIVNKGAEKAFALLYGAMMSKGVVGIGKMVMKDKEHLVALMPYDGVILMSVLRWADEIRPTAELKNGAVVLGEKEIALAGKLVESLLAKTFDHAKYTDEYEKRVQQMIQAKIDGKPVVQDAVKMPEATGDDLIGALMASLNTGDAVAAANSDNVVAAVEAEIAAVPAGAVPVMPEKPEPALAPGVEVVPTVPAQAEPEKKPELQPVGAVAEEKPKAKADKADKVNAKVNAKLVPGMVKCEIVVTRGGKTFTTSTWKRLEDAQKKGYKITDWGVTPQPVAG